MPRIFDNIEADQILLDELKKGIQEAYRADFCVGYFNLRGWRAIANDIEGWDGGEGKQCRVLVGMQPRPDEEFKDAMRQMRDTNTIDNATAIRLKKKLAEEFRTQLTIGTPSNADEQALRQLAEQLKSGKVVVKLYLEYPLHAKLYLLYQDNRRSPIVSMLGSSNLTMAGLSGQGELNIEELDNDTCQKLAKWFEERWDNRWCIDISKELIEIINTSWASPTLTPPYHVYIKMAYHLSQEARAGINEFRIPRDLDPILFDYQKAAVKVAAHHLNKRGGVLIGDVVGLGKTLMATTLARIFEDDFGYETLIICPPNLREMWRTEYAEAYGLRGYKILSTGKAREELPTTRRYRIVIIDESHNFRNREGKTYRAIKEYLDKNESHVILLSATPYNKTYLDLSAQLRLFVPEDKNLGIRPESLIREMGEIEFNRRHQTGLRTLSAFEKSDHADDWRELMRLYMIRRTRSFIQDNYAKIDPISGKKYLSYTDRETGEERYSYFPKRTPRTLKFDVNEGDQYGFLYNDDVVNIIRHLELPRYGLGQYIDTKAEKTASAGEKLQLENLSKAGKRLIGFSRTNLFKRLESSGSAFLQSLERHIIRNAIYLYALENGKPLPIGTQDIAILDARIADVDLETIINADDDGNEPATEEVLEDNPTVEWMARAQAIYKLYETQYKTRFKWIDSRFFQKKLARDLQDDADKLYGILEQCGVWQSAQDAKLNLLTTLLTKTHPHDKVLIFTQFADTVTYLERELKVRGVKQMAGVVGKTGNPTDMAHRFSPNSNKKQVKPEDELRVLIATDVLSEGQNLQDAHIVVNYDIAWAIIRLIQRAGRVDRIGQKADEIRCYSFLPTDGVERIIRLRQRIMTRLQENAEVVGTDEQFFEDEDRSQILDLYNEKSNILDEEGDSDVDLSSYALEIWNKAIENNPALKNIIEKMPMVAFATRQHIPNPEQPNGVLVYLRTAESNDLLAWLDKEGNIISESQFGILNAARCTPDEPALERANYHHEAVGNGIVSIVEAQKNSPIGGQLGRPSGARFRVYERLKAFGDTQMKTLFYDTYEKRGLYRAIEEIYRYPLRPVATDTLNRQLKAGIRDDDLAELVMTMREEERLCIISEDDSTNRDPRIICSMGLFNQ